MSYLDKIKKASIEELENPNIFLESAIEEAKKRGEWKELLEEKSRELSTAPEQTFPPTRKEEMTGTSLVPLQYLVMLLKNFEENKAIFEEMEFADVWEAVCKSKIPALGAEELKNGYNVVVTFPSKAHAESFEEILTSQMLVFH